MRVRAVCFAGLTAAAVLAAGGCGSGKGSAATADNGGKNAHNNAVKANTALDFHATTLDGGTFEGTSLAGKPAVLWFWAPWCGTCNAQAPGTAAVAKDYAGKVNVLGVAGLDKEGPMHKFVAKHGLGGVTNLSDGRGDVWKRFSVTRQSIYVLLDAKGKERGRGSFGGEADLRERIDAMLG